MGHPTEAALYAAPPSHICPFMLMSAVQRSSVLGDVFEDISTSQHIGTPRPLVVVRENMFSRTAMSGHLPPDRRSHSTGARKRVFSHQYYGAPSPVVLVRKNMFTRAAMSGHLPTDRPSCSTGARKHVFSHHYYGAPRPVVLVRKNMFLGAS